MKSIKKINNPKKKFKNVKLNNNNKNPVIIYFKSVIEILICV